MSESSKTEDAKKGSEEAGQDTPPGIEVDVSGAPEEDASDETERLPPFGDVEGLGAAHEELPAEEPEAPAQAQPKPKRGRQLIVALVVVVVVFAAGVVAWPLMAPRLSAYLPAGLVFGGVMADKVEALDSRVSALEAKAGQRDPALDRLEADAAALSNSVAASVSDIDARITALESTAPSARLDDLAGRIESLEGAAPQVDDRLVAKVDGLTARLQALEAGLAQQGGNGPETGAAIAAALERIASVERAQSGAEERNQQLAARLDTAEETSARLAGDLAAQNERIAGMEEKIAAQDAAQKAAVSGDARGAALALAIGQLRAALKSSTPFESELSALGELTADAGEAVRKPLDVLRPLAPVGVPTLAILQARFEGTASAVVRAAVAGGEDWMSRTLARLSSLVTVRRTGEVAGSEPAAVVARAEQRLGEGDLGAAVAELSSLSGAPAEAAAAWLADARNRLTADAAVEDLHAAAVSTLGR